MTTQWLCAVMLIGTLLGTKSNPLNEEVFSSTAATFEVQESNSSNDSVSQIPTTTMMPIDNLTEASAQSGNSPQNPQNQTQEPPQISQIPFTIPTQQSNSRVEVGNGRKVNHAPILNKPVFNPQIPTFDLNTESVTTISTTEANTPTTLIFPVHLAPISSQNISRTTSRPVTQQITPFYPPSTLPTSHGSFLPSAPLFDIPSNLNFTCHQRLPGYYADTETDCKVWHWCTLGGRHFDFLCPLHTAFNQAHRVCDWWYNVNCASSPALYYINQDLYQVSSN